MAEFPALPLWTDAYLADTTHLTPFEHGVYFLLLMAAWRSPSCDLPDDDERLCRFARCTPKEWVKTRPILIEFFLVENGRWIQKRLSSERQIVSEISEIRSRVGQNGGKKSASIRRTKYLEKLRLDEANASFCLEKQPEKLKQTSSKIQPPTPTPTPTPIEEEEPPMVPSLELAIVVAQTGDPFERFWSAYPHKVAKDAGRRAFAKAIRIAPLESIIAAIDRYRATKPPDRPWANPATWLNGHRWLDQPATDDGPIDYRASTSAMLQQMENDQCLTPTAQPPRLKLIGN